jgi:B12-binding domain/radical SAM domain protein
MKVLGVAAPNWVSRGIYAYSKGLNSSDPFSLYNAYRVAASSAEEEQGYWSKSNWSTYEGRENSILLMTYFEEEKEDFKRKLVEIKPDLLLIGSMTLSFAGAIEIAKIAKEILGEKVFIVLGGKHVIETMYIKNGKIIDAYNSPLQLMLSKKIDSVFDLVLSGDGEYTILNIGNIIGYLRENNLDNSEFFNYLAPLKSSKGNWCAGWLEDGKPSYILTKCSVIDYDSIPLTSEMFPIRNKFNVFDANLTAHAFSDISKGCIFDCFYCSEKRSINGKLDRDNVKQAPYRLAKNLKSIQNVGISRYGYSNMSAFIEDSIILSGNSKSLANFEKALEMEKVNLEFGGQFTVDTLLKNKDQIKNLKKYGFKYVFFGIETNNDEIAAKMSKNINTKIVWMDKNEEVISFLCENNILCGVSLLFGLGETQDDRLSLLLTIRDWMQKYKNLCVVSLNWAVKHPLQLEDSQSFDYIEWGTPKNSEYLGIFTELFGEASEKYCMSGVSLPPVDELLAIKSICDELNLLN